MCDLGAFSAKAFLSTTLLLAAYVSWLGYLGYLLQYCPELEIMASLAVPNDSKTGRSNGGGATFAAPSSPQTVILGSGIIGLSAAYFLCESGNTPPGSICLVDSSPELFRCASGLAAGFCAKDCMYLLVYQVDGWLLWNEKKRANCGILRVRTICRFARRAFVRTSQESRGETSGETDVGICPVDWSLAVAGL